AWPGNGLWCDSPLRRCFFVAEARPRNAVAQPYQRKVPSRLWRALLSTMHGEQRLILILANEWSKTAHCSPHRYYGQDENTRGSFALSEAEGGPNDNRTAKKSDGIVFG